MIKFIFISVAAICLLLDYLASRRIFAATRSILLRCAWIGSIAIITIAPIISTLIMGHIVDDNTSSVMHVTSWLFTIYISTLITRIAFYIGWLPLRRHRRLGLALGSTLSTVVLTQLIVGIAHTRTNIATNHQTLYYTTLPKSFDGYRIALFADLHIGSMLNPEEESARLVEIINSTEADAVVFAGDLTHIRHDEITPQIAAILANIKARDGVISVLGNHDTGVYIKDSVTLSRHENTRLFAEKIDKIGWRLLRDNTAYITRDCDSIAITGIDFSDRLLEFKHALNAPEDYDPQRLYRQIPDNTFSICISHLPQLWDNAFWRYNLTLAGHVHATQIKFSCGNFALSPAMLLYNEWSGLYKRNNNDYLYINDGIGCVGFFMRIGAKPEVTVIELHHKDSD